MTSRILVFTGNGKGKTTAALGMALRAWGHGIKPVIVQFVKNFQETGEFMAIKKLDGIEIIQTGLGFPPKDPCSSGFMDHMEKSSAALETVAEIFARDEYGLVVLDEICFAVSAGLLKEEQVLATLEKAPDSIILVLTGRGATPGLIDIADTVTEMKNVRHAYENGIMAASGVEY